MPRVLDFLRNILCSTEYSYGSTEVSAIYPTFSIAYSIYSTSQLSISSVLYTAGSLRPYLHFMLIIGHVPVVLLNEASCAGRESSLVCPPVLSGILQRHILSTRLVPVYDLDTKPYEYYCWVGPMVIRIS